MTNVKQVRRVNRRHALRTIAAGVGATASALWVENLRVLAQDHAAHLAATTSPQAASYVPKAMNAHQFETVGTLVELIIPTTDTPGARTALVDRYVDSVLVSARKEDRDRFLAGLKWLDARSSTLFRSAFIGSTPAQQADLLTRLSAEGAGNHEPRTGVEFFTAIKTMTIAGYYTTEIGLRQELGDDGRLMLAAFEGCTHPEHQ
jgi:hypothetical protein